MGLSREYFRQEDQASSDIPDRILYRLLVGAEIVRDRHWPLTSASSEALPPRSADLAAALRSLIWLAKWSDWWPCKGIFAPYKVPISSPGQILVVRDESSKKPRGFVPVR